MDKLLGKVKDNIYLIILFILVFILHARMNLSISDDAVIKHILSEKTVFEHMGNLYFNVNGKILPDTMAAIFTYVSPWWFKCIDSMMYVVMAYCIFGIFLQNVPKGKMIASIAVLYFPMKLLTSAGYVATSTNYIWTLTSLFVVTFFVKKVIAGEEIKSYVYIFFSVAVLYAGNQEQSCVISLVCLTGGLVYYLRQKKCVPFLIRYGVALEVFCLIFILTAPGHSKRALSYGKFVIPNYPQLGLLDKIYLGITTTIAHFLTWDSILFISFLIILILIVWTKHTEILYRIMSFCPLVILIFMNVVKFKNGGVDELNEVVHFNFEWGFNQETFAIIDASNYDQWIYYLPILICGLLIVSILICFFVISDTMEDFMTYLFLIGMGFASRMIMAFSPTLFGSGTRTYAYMYFCLICIVVCMISKNNRIRYNVLMKSVFIVGAVVSFYVSYIGII